VLKSAVEVAAGREDVVRMIDDLYARVQRSIDARKPLCSISGRCCRFEDYGHRLYVTTLELAAFLKQHLGADVSSWDGTGCPFQVNKLCSVHTLRPFGCRMFFCDPSATDWQNETYERFHAELKTLHEHLGVPYYYVEWRRALVELGLAPDLLAPQSSF
jgi:Fe-S-cluster containining protein